MALESMILITIKNQRKILRNKRATPREAHPITEGSERQVPIEMVPRLKNQNLRKL
jgi:hypothetical protein